jgi:3-oxoacyl-[acyl-carrier protein] reductase
VNGLASELAVVSGGTKGIGLAFSSRLIKLGFRVVAFHHSDTEAAQAAMDRLHPALHAVRVDVSDFDAVCAAASTVLNQHGVPQVLVNNAGVNVDRPFLELTVNDWRKVLDTNLSGVFHLCKALVPAMLDADHTGVIVNVGATTGIRPRRNGANYCASKAGLLQLTKCLALELAPRIRVNCLIPGNTETEELITRFRLDDLEARAGMLAEIPQQRLGSTEDIADALEFLVGPGSSYLTGQKIIVDGGQFMW